MQPPKKQRLFVYGFFHKIKYPAKVELFHHVFKNQEEYELHCLECNKSATGCSTEYDITYWPSNIYDYKRIKSGLHLDRDLMERFFESAYQETYHRKKIYSRSKSSRFIKSITVPLAIRVALMKIGFMLKQLKVTSSDTIIIFGEFSASIQIIADHFKKQNAKVIFSEGFDIFQSFTFSPDGVAHKVNAPDEVAPKRDSLIYIKDCFNSTISQRTSIKDHLYSEGRIRKDKGKSTSIYLNLVENFYSGLTPRCNAYSKEYSPLFKSNLEMVKLFEEYTKDLDCHIFYKDHPNTISGAPHLLVDYESDRVTNLGNISIHEVIDHVDLIVSNASKVISLSLAKDTPVFLTGPYHIDPEKLTSGLYSGEFLPFIQKFIDGEISRKVDRESLYHELAKTYEHCCFSADTSFLNTKDKEAFLKYIENEI